MIGRVVIGIVVVVVLIVSLVFILFYKPDLSKEDLAKRYISKNSRFVRLTNGAEVHYRDEGNRDGEVLVMIHGGFGSLHNWEGWVKHLSDDFRLISIDLLGHGLTGDYPANIYTRISNRETIHTLLHMMNVKRYSIAGNSFGGGVALEIALQYPDEVEGLILIDSEGIPNSEQGYDASQFTSEKPVHPDDPEYTKLSFMEQLGSKFIGPSVIKSQLKSLIYNHNLIDDDFADYYGRILRYRGNRGAQILMFRQGLYLVTSNHPMDLLPRLNEISCPALIMHGEKDGLVPVAVAERFNKHITISDLCIIDNAGHMPMIEKPEETADCVKLFFKKYNIGVGR